MKDFRDKVVVVTGAGSGIGRELAVKLAQKGAKVAISDVDAAGLATTERLVGMIPEGRIAVSESGINSHDDCLRLSNHGVRSFLVGESLMRQPDVTIATRTLLTGAAA